MELIMKNPTERELMRARMDAVIDQRTMMKSAERRGRAEGQIETLAGLVKKGMITLADAANEANLPVNEFARKAGLPISN